MQDMKQERVLETLGPVQPLQNYPEKRKWTKERELTFDIIRAYQLCQISQYKFFMSISSWGQIHLFIYLFIYQVAVKTCYVPGIVLSAEYWVVRKTALALLEFNSVAYDFSLYYFKKIIFWDRQDGFIAKQGQR